MTEKLLEIIKTLDRHRYEVFNSKDNEAFHDAIEILGELTEVLSRINDKYDEITRYDNANSIVEYHQFVVNELSKMIN